MPIVKKRASADDSSVLPAETIIIVHGAFGQPKDGEPRWYDPHSPFCRDLDARLAEMGSAARCWHHLRCDEAIFSWDGKNTWLARANAAAALRGELRTLANRGCRCHIIAHSHGGNIALDALDFNNGGPPDWFTGKVVLLGAPIIEVAHAKVRHATIRSLTPLMLALIPLIVLLSPAWVNRSQAMENGGSLLRLLALNAVVFIEVLYVLGLLFSVTNRYESLRRGLSDQGDKRLCIINSQADEAYTFMRSILDSENPFFPHESAGDTPASARISSRRAKQRGRGILGLHREILIVIRRRTFALFPGARELPYVQALVAALCLILIPLYFEAYGPHPMLGWLLPLFVLAVVFASQLKRLTGLGIQGIYATFLRPIHGFFTYTVRLLRYIYGASVGQFMGRYWRTRAWRTMQAYALGLTDSPFQPHQIALSLVPAALSDAVYEYIELPEAAVRRIVENRDALLTEQTRRAFQHVLYDDFTAYSLGRQLRDVFAGHGLPLVHSCYYTAPESLALIARWIGAPSHTGDSGGPP